MPSAKPAISENIAPGGARRAAGGLLCRSRRPRRPGLSRTRTRRAIRPLRSPIGAKQRLTVPPGHPRAGEPMALPAYATKFFRDALKPGVREARLFVARKNGKSAVLAVLIPAHLADDGPLWRRCWR